MAHDRSDITYLSLGAGVQSTAMYFMSSRGKMGVPRADVAIFADTGDEPAWVYEHLDWMRGLADKEGIPIKVTSAGHLSEDFVGRLTGERTRSATIPLFVRGNGGRSTILPRHCTKEYKLRPIIKAVREMLGLRRKQKAPGKYTARCLIGISTDEVMRCKPSRLLWVENVFPLIEAHVSRDDCIRFLKESGLRVPRKSSCIFCPFHSDGFWADMKRNHPAEFAAACEFDDSIRDMRVAGMDKDAYLHRYLIPLSKIEFKAEPSLWDDGLQNECEGMCGV